MSLSNKKIKQINFLSVIPNLLKDYDGQKIGQYIDATIFDSPPNTWSKEEVVLFDLLQDLESRLKEEIIKVL